MPSADITTMSVALEAPTQQELELLDMESEIKSLKKQVFDMFIRAYPVALECIKLREEKRRLILRFNRLVGDFCLLSGKTKKVQEKLTTWLDDSDESAAKRAKWMEPIPVKPSSEPKTDPGLQGQKTLASIASTLERAQAFKREIIFLKDLLRLKSIDAVYRECNSLRDDVQLLLSDFDFLERDFDDLRSKYRRVRKRIHRLRTRKAIFREGKEPKH
jgi:hypothetical protein